jgi:hypothetical protein
VPGTSAASPGNVISLNTILDIKKQEISGKTMSHNVFKYPSTSLSLFFATEGTEDTEGKNLRSFWI